MAGAGTSNPSFPHTRGGGPSNERTSRKYRRFSPHAWGWTDKPEREIATADVFPTRVGVDRLAPFTIVLYPSFPHTRGGGPSRSITTPPTLSFSPHAWGWTDNPLARPHENHVFLTRVGVDRMSPMVFGVRSRFPHTRGGGPHPRGLVWSHYVFSPHAWGWTARHFADLVNSYVFPTRVGVDRSPERLFCQSMCFPHTRGGGPLGAT